MVVRHGRQLICGDEFTSIWMTVGETLYAAHTPCGDDGQWSDLATGKLKCFKCGSVHPRWATLTVADQVNIHAPRSVVERWVAWFYNVLPEEVKVSIT